MGSKQPGRPWTLEEEFYDVDDLSAVNRFYGGAAEARPDGGD